MVGKECRSLLTLAVLLLHLKTLFTFFNNTLTRYRVHFDVELFCLDLQSHNRISKTKKGKLFWFYKKTNELSLTLTLPSWIHFKYLFLFVWYLREILTQNIIFTLLRSRKAYFGASYWSPWIDLFILFLHHQFNVPVCLTLWFIPVFKMIILIWLKAELRGLLILFCNCTK